MDAAAVDQISLNFNRSGLFALNAVIGLMMYGMALDMKLDDFKRVIRSPKGPAIGLGAQFVLLPAFTFLLTLVLPVTPSMALGMMLVAACPGGNLSNVMTYLAGGNAALSVSMTAVSTAAAVVMTPLNLSLWGSLNPATHAILRQVSLDPLDVFQTIVLILGIPLVLGIGTSRFYPQLADKIRRPFKTISVVIFCLFVAAALGANWQNFLRAIGLVAFGVFLHNALALNVGYWSARLFPPAGTGPPGGLDRSRHSELGTGAGVDFPVFRGAGRYGDHCRLVGDLAHHFRIDHGLFLVPSTHRRDRGGASQMKTQSTSLRSVMVTGAGGYLGRLLVAALAQDRRELTTVVASDLRPVPPDQRLPGVTYLAADICAPELAQALAEFKVDAVVHLAAVVTPGRKSDRQLEYRVDVLGTQNVLDASLRSGVKKLIYTSSGAAYGYHADNAAWLDEEDPIRGNEEFAYSWHKRLVEEMLARCRREHPELEQLILRPGTILGAGTANQITNLFDQPRITGLKGADSPFVFIWDQDVVGAILKGIFEGGSGIYNMAGDGALTLREIAGLLGKPYRELPVWLVTAALWIGKRLGLTRYGPEQVGFLRYRPVLGNRRLKTEFGYEPRKTTREVFEYFLEHRRHGH